MCLAVPSRVVAVSGLMATVEMTYRDAIRQAMAFYAAIGKKPVEAFGERREVSLMLMEEDRAVAIGDYLLIQAGGFAFERLDLARAEDTLALMSKILGDENDGLIWGTS